MMPSSVAGMAGSVNTMHATITAIGVRQSGEMVKLVLRPSRMGWMFATMAPAFSGWKKWPITR